jgi:ankyrin repeat protein
VLVEAQTEQAIEAPMLCSVGVLMGGTFKALLLTSIAASGHNDAAASIELLLQAGAAVDAVSNSVGIIDRTALMVACSICNNLHAVQALLRGGADPCRQASGGIAALHLAASAGFTEVCRALYTASSSVLELRGDGSTLSATPLIAAVSLDQYAVVKLLCSLGADVNHSDVAGNTALMVAAAEGENIDVLCLLLQQSRIDVNQRNDKGVQPYWQQQNQALLQQ